MTEVIDLCDLCDDLCNSYDKDGCQQGFEHCDEDEDGCEQAFEHCDEDEDGWE